jgi:hypothetical protein
MIQEVIYFPALHVAIFTYSGTYIRELYDPEPPTTILHQKTRVQASMSQVDFYI